MTFKTPHSHFLSAPKLLVLLINASSSSAALNKKFVSPTLGSLSRLRVPEEYTPETGGLAEMELTPETGGLAEMELTPEPQAELEATRCVSLHHFSVSGSRGVVIGDVVTASDASTESAGGLGRAGGEEWMEYSDEDLLPKVWWW
jgi:hypothetical protein